MARQAEEHDAVAAEPVPAETEPSRWHRRRASHLYGLIISGSVLAAAPVSFGLVRIALAVMGTLAVYWTAETYAHWIAARSIHGPDLTQAQHHAVFRDGLPLVAAGAVPVGVLLVEALVDVEVSRGVDIALLVNLALLLGLGWRMSRSGGLHGVRLVLSTLVTGMLGVAMIALKLALHH